jgi:acyl-CoA synthetase (AMP-forming)/AMP-acid ligase II
LIGSGFLQYTSGSTSAPKGVTISHTNLASQAEVLREKLCVTGESRVVSWLPLFHDMGLISVLTGLAHGCTINVIPSVHFVQTPLIWLEAISEERATHSGAPNFAFDLVARKLAASPPQPFDLSSWTYASCGAEPVNAQVMRAFADACAPFGFDRRALYPCYGLAEATLLVTGSNTRRGVSTLACDQASIEKGHVQLAAEGEESVTLVSCGQPARDHDVIVIDPASCAPCGELQIGEVCVRGPSVSAGYWLMDDSSAESSTGMFGTPDGDYLRTGDLGFFYCGDLYITGRIKDVVIRNGRNIYPQDVEALVSGVDTPATLGRCGAFGLSSDPQARMIVVIEIRRLGDVDLEHLRAMIARLIRTELEETNFEVVFVRYGQTPTTSSGKLRRGELRRLYQSGALVLFDAAPVKSGGSSDAG